MTMAHSRRQVVQTFTVGAACSLVGCTARVIGWSALRIHLTNTLDRPVRIELTIRVNGTEAFRRPFDLDANEETQTTATLDIPWGAILTFRVTRDGRATDVTNQWTAETSLWGDTCRIEPVVVVGPGETRIESCCG